jgi:hypothetical protein
MTVQRVVPGPDRGFGRSRPPSIVPSPESWTSLRPEIERLYLRERRRLRHVRQYMEEMYGFRATYDRACRAGEVD